jgi:superfamily I DNA/RNA helicase
MNLTQEQQEIVAHCKSSYATASGEIVLVNSVAGSGKTTLLTAISAALPHTRSCYLAYNRSVATEAQQKFPKTTVCSTTHSLAYQAVVKPFNLKVGNFSYRDIKETITYDHKLEILDLIREFCLSSHTTFESFATTLEVTPFTVSLCNKYLQLMETGKIECTHDFYLKVFHLALLNDLVTYEPFDFIMLDEIGDVNEVTLEIFLLLPAKLKVGTGDQHQNIYSFNHTINAFTVLRDKATFFNMTQSFRVKDSIASSIENFCKAYLHESMSFRGIPISDTTITTRAIITRTNAALVAYMIDLEEQGIPFSLVRKASDIYKLPLLVCSFKHNSTINDPMYRHVQDDINHFFDYEIRAPENRGKNLSLFSYLMNLHSHDFPLVQALKLVSRHGSANIIKSYNHARSYENGPKRKQSLFLASSHSCKGLEFDEVTIGTDMNEMVGEIVTKLKTNPDYVPSIDETNELNLYYVACSRAKKILNNALLLDTAYQLELNFDD